MKYIAAFSCQPLNLFSNYFFIVFDLSRLCLHSNIHSVLFGGPANWLSSIIVHVPRLFVVTNENTSTNLNTTTQWRDNKIFREFPQSQKMNGARMKCFYLKKDWDGYERTMTLETPQLIVWNIFIISPRNNRNISMGVYYREWMSKFLISHVWYF